MPARAISSGTISFGLVSIPIKVFTATSGKDVHFSMLHEKDKSRLKQQYVCATCGEIVERNATVKGYEYSKGQYVVVSDEELQSLAEEDGPVDRDRGVRPDRRGRPDLLREVEPARPRQGRPEGVPAPAPGDGAVQTRGGRALLDPRPPAAGAPAPDGRRARDARALLRRRGPQLRRHRDRHDDRDQGRGARAGQAADRSAVARQVPDREVRGRVPPLDPRGGRSQGGRRRDRHHASPRRRASRSSTWSRR